MNVGTRSVLFGAHCPLVHPWFVAAAWWKLYGFPRDPRLWVAFFVHDIGYWGKPNMDGAEGEDHVWPGAKLMGALFDADAALPHPCARWLGPLFDRVWGKQPHGMSWYCFTFYHSRSIAQRYGVDVSRLCIADKYSICLTPWWLYGAQATLSGEIDEYVQESKTGKYKDLHLSNGSMRRWHGEMQAYLRRWVAEHKDTTGVEADSHAR